MGNPLPAHDPGFAARNATPDLATALRAAARRALADGLTQGELAEAAGMTQPQLSAWLAGRKTITLDTAARLLAALGLRADLVPDHSPPPTG